MKIAIDAMGGDKAPGVIIDAVNEFASENKNIELLVFGPINQLSSLDLDAENIELINTTEVIENNEEPVKAIRSKKDSSMVRAANAVKKGEADGLISLGSTGALLSSGIFIIGRTTGVSRPGLMPTLPNQTTKVFNMVDVGANNQNRPEQLVQYAQMGSIYAKDIRKVENPKVALLNNGSEAHKGDPLHVETYQLLEKLTDINFVGNVESNNILTADVDVVVTDGFTGNATLKAVEGTTKVVTGLFKQAFMDNGIAGKIAGSLVYKSLKSIKQEFDVSSYGGAILLGIKKPVVKGHGNSDVATVKSTLKQLANLIEQETIEKFNKLMD